MDINRDFITVNKYSRPGTRRPETLGAVIHWTENPGTSAQFTRAFYEDLKEGVPSYHNPEKIWYGSAHYAIGIDGEIVQIMPEDEVAYHVGALSYTQDAKDAFGKYCADPYRTSPNFCTVGIELSHEDWTGEFTVRTLESAVELFADICHRYNIPVTYLMRHYDITGKICPKYFVNHEEAFYDFRIEVAKTIRFELEYHEKYRGRII